MAAARPIRHERQRVTDPSPRASVNPEPLQLPHSVRLGDLIEAVDASHPDALDRLSAAVVVADHLGDVADQLLGHYVDQARRAGASWTEIGRCMGVTKQAAQKRFVSKGSDQPLNPEQGFSRFTTRARNVVISATNLARTAGSADVGAAHLLLGVVRESQGIGRLAIEAAGASADADARDALEGAYREALRLGDQHVGTEHLALALLEREQATAENGVLRSLGVDKATLERHVTQVAGQERADRESQ